MKQLEEKCYDQHPTVKGLAITPESQRELPEIILITLAIVGSIMGAIGGAFISKLWLDGFSPEASGTFGCMLGCLILTTVGYYCWMLFHSAKTTDSNLRDHGSVEKCME
jgi:hypothetical protein